MGKLSKSASGHSLNFVVGTKERGPNLSKKINGYFGCDPNQIGHLTPEMVRTANQTANALKQQRMLAKEFVKALEKIIEYKTEIEKLRLDAQKAGRKGVEEIESYVADAILEAHGHEHKVREIMQKLAHGKGVLDAEHVNTRRYENQSYSDRLRVLNARHKQRMGQQREKTAANLSEISTNGDRKKRELQQQRDFKRYIAGGDAGGFRPGRMVRGLFA